MAKSILEKLKNKLSKKKWVVSAEIKKGIFVDDLMVNTKEYNREQKLLIQESSNEILIRNNKGKAITYKFDKIPPYFYIISDIQNFS